MINLHHLGGQIRAALGDGTRLRRARSPTPRRIRILDTGGGDRGGARLSARATRFVVLNADTFIDLDLRDVDRLARRAAARWRRWCCAPIPTRRATDDIAIDADAAHPPLPRPTPGRCVGAEPLHAR